VITTSTLAAALAAAPDLPPPLTLADAPFPARESHSSVSTYEACPLRYANRYLLHLPGADTRSWYGFGSAVHAAFEAFDRARIAAGPDGALPPYEVLAEAFAASVDRSGCDPDLIARWRVRAEPVLRRYLEREAASDDRPIAVELGFGLDLVPGEGAEFVRFVGYIDRIDRQPDGSIAVLDHKTGWARGQAEVDADRQLTAYAFACARGAVLDPATGVPLPAPSRLGLHFADTGVTVWTTRSPEAIEEFGRALGATVAAIRGRAFEATPGDACRWCEYRATCPEAAPAA